MKPIWIIGGALIVGMMAGQAIDVVSGKRLSIFNSKGNPAVIATSDETGAGTLIVYDSDGNEVFAVRHGAISGIDLDGKIERAVRDAMKPATTHPQVSAPVSPLSPSGQQQLNADDQGAHGLKLILPDLFKGKRVMRVEIEKLSRHDQGKQTKMSLVLRTVNLTAT